MELQALSCLLQVKAFVFFFFQEEKALNMNGGSVNTIKGMNNQ